MASSGRARRYILQSVLWTRACGNWRSWPGANRRSAHGSEHKIHNWMWRKDDRSRCARPTLCVLAFAQGGARISQRLMSKSQRMRLQEMNSRNYPALKRGDVMHQLRVIAIVAASLMTSAFISFDGAAADEVLQLEAKIPL